MSWYESVRVGMSCYEYGTRRAYENDRRSFSRRRATAPIRRLPIAALRLRLRRSAPYNYRHSQRCGRVGECASAAARRADSIWRTRRTTPPPTADSLRRCHPRGGRAGRGGRTPSRRSTPTDRLRLQSRVPRSHLTLTLALALQAESGRDREGRHPFPSSPCTPRAPMATRHTQPPRSEHHARSLALDSVLRCQPFVLPSYSYYSAGDTSILVRHC